MMKLSYAVNTLVASILVVPALTLQGDGNGGLERSLRETVRALEYLTGLETRVHADPRASVALVQQATEPPLTDARERDEKLVQLRDEVARLQMIHDELLGRASAPGIASHVALADAASISSQGAVTTGLSEDARLSISGAPPPRPAHAPIGESLEAEGFCADPARRGQALYRAGRYGECVAFLAKIENDPRAAYWLARAHEKLGHIDDALRGYRWVAQAKDAGTLAQNARADLEFLEWQREFAKKLASTAASSTGAEAPH